MGLFMQSGVLLRAAIEDSFVLVDIIEDMTQIDKLLNDKYKTLTDSELETMVKKA